MLPRPPMMAAEKAMAPRQSPREKLIIVEPIHKPGESGEPRADGKGNQNDGGEIDAHGAGGFLVLRDRADGEAKLRAVEQVLNANDHQNTGRQHQYVVEAQIEGANV